MAVDLEHRKAYNTMWRRKKRAESKAASEAAEGNNGESAANTGLDAYGFPIGTHDAQGRKYGQLDDLYEERDVLRTKLAGLEYERESLEKEKFAVPLSSESDTTKQKINIKAQLIAIRELTEDADAKIKVTKEAIEQNKASIAKYEAEYETVKKNLDEYSKGGQTYTNKLAYAEVALRDAEQRKRAAKATLEGKSVEQYSEAQQQLRSANEAIARWSNIGEWLDGKRREYEELMKIYRR